MTLQFGELGYDVYVTLRNPKVLPPDFIRPKDIPVGPDGMPLNPADAENEMYAIISRLIRDWCVYDATSDDDNQPRLPLPATPELIRKLPMMIITKITEELAKAVNPS